MEWKKVMRKGQIRALPALTFRIRAKHSVDSSHKKRSPYPSPLLSLSRMGHEYFFHRFTRHSLVD